MMGKICIHGHFYQPPRENPWTGVVEREHSASPWHDWNQRITDECYGPNTAARILDGKGRILKLSDNYSRISYDFGPTLLTWLEREQGERYENIIRSDARAQDCFSGHGNALAHPYHHVIMPLLSRTDKETEIRWGIRDFEERFGRYPEGLWLPEMAVDTETLDVLADHGIRFTILSPHQAARTGKCDEASIKETEGMVSKTAPYSCHLPGGNKITIFFHDSDLGTRVAFGDLLKNGDGFSDVLLTAASDGGLVHFATDGETFGHHHRFGEMALAWCLDRIESTHPGTLTIYGEYLETNTPEQEVEITENTSWSCPHGIRRWTGGCDCGSGRHQGWSHEWRGPLRNAVAAISTALLEIYQREAGRIFENPLAARDDAARLLSDPSRSSIDRFFSDHVKRAVTPREREKALALLEMTRRSLAMQTSCAWFFDDIADREAVQVLRNAARAMQLARDWTGTELEPGFIKKLSAIHGNRAGYPDGGVVYNECVLPLVLDLEREAACLVLMDAVREGDRNRSKDLSPGEFLTCGEVQPWHDLSFLGKVLRYCFMVSGDTARLGVSFEGDCPIAELTDSILRPSGSEEDIAAFQTLVGSFPIIINVSDFTPPMKRLLLKLRISKITRAFSEMAGGLIDGYIGAEPLIEEPVLSFSTISSPAWCLIHSRIERLLASPESTAEDLQNFVRTVTLLGLSSPLALPQQDAGRFMKRLMEDWAYHPDDHTRLARITQALRLFSAIGIHPPSWDLQNIFIAVRDGLCRHPSGKEHEEAWRKEFHELGDVLGVNTGRA